uniref:GNAT family N-acetyltransferase n=1 Tax=Fulvivirga sp. TaxID=1931237 RepID=UPI00404B0E32
MIIRKAARADSKSITAHLFLAMEDILYKFIGEKNEEKAMTLLLFFVEKKGNQYSFENCLVAEENGEVIGSINIYDGGKLDDLRSPVVQYIKSHFNPDFNPERETQAGEYYIDSFGVNRGQQGKGIGTKLLQYVIDEYVIKNNQTLGLLVDEDNPLAKKLYLKLGFEVVGKKTLASKKLEHLQIKA